MESVGLLGRACVECNATLPARKPGPGRRRLRCATCWRRKAPRPVARSQEPRTCARCGVEFREPRRTGPPAARCPECRKRRGHAHDAAFRRQCQGCGVMRRNATWVRWCSPECKPSRSKGLTLPRFDGQRICEWCGHAFLTANSRMKFCSSGCRGNGLMAGKFSPVPWSECHCCGSWFVGRRGRRYCSAGCPSRPRRQPSISKVCAECDASYIASARQATQQRYCSPLCSRRAQRRRVRKRHGRRDNFRKTARLLGVKYEPLSPRKIFDRDGWRCGICRKRVDRRLKHPHPLSVSLDHIVPMNGIDRGDHVASNVQCAHLRCNYEKGRTGSSQLRLIA